MQLNEEEVNATIEATIETWFAKHFHGLGGKLDTDLYNIIHAAKEDLKKILHVRAVEVVPEPLAQSPSPDTAPAIEES